jgi:Tol biopolymer transport system component
VGGKSVSVNSSTGGPRTNDSSPDAARVTSQLQRILESEAFEKTEQLRELLRFLVEETLAGRGRELREKRLGEQVFHRGPDFNPADDNIVRVRARDLRKRLAEYYATEGVADDLAIDIPKGGYVANFEPRRSEAHRPASPLCASSSDVKQISRRWSLTAASIIVAVALAASFLASAKLGHVERYAPTERRRLTYEPGFASNPAPSADGRAFVFTSDRDDEGDLDVWMQTLDGPAVQLTDLPGNEMTPDWSPDGKQVAFRSFYRGGGIYVVSVDNHYVRKLSDFGYWPRFTPDGRWISFTGQKGSNTHSIFVVPIEGGVPVRIPLGPYNTLSALWHPGGRHLLFHGYGPAGVLDWRVAEITPSQEPRIGRVLSLRVNQAPSRSRGHPYIRQFDQPSDWIGDTVLYGGAHDESDLGAVPLALPEWRLQQAPYLLMAGPVAAMSRVIPDPAGRQHRIIYSIERGRTHLYTLQVTDSRHQGEPRVRTRDLSLLPGVEKTMASISAMGDRLAYCSGRSGSKDIVIVNTASGQETPIADSAAEETHPVISPSGRQIAFSVKDASGQVVELVDVQTRSRRRLCSDCGFPKDWSADGRTILLVRDGALFALTVDDGRIREIFRKPDVTVMESSISPEGIWVALSLLRAQQEEISVVLAPFGPSGLAPESEWIPIGAELYHFQADWSPDGNWIYYFKSAHDYRCLWAQRLNARTKRPIGEPVIVRHFHRYQRYPVGGARVIAGRGMVVVNLTDILSDIWMATLERR